MKEYILHQSQKILDMYFLFPNPCFLTNMKRYYDMRSKVKS